MSFRVSIVQQPLVWGEPEANRAHFASVLSELRDSTDLVVLPEMFTTGFTMRPDQLAEPAQGPTRAWLLSQAALLDAAVGGSVAVVDQGRFFNRFMLATPSGELHVYDKRHLFRMGGEHLHYAPGARPLVVEWRGARLCPMVCYDLRFPVWSRRRPQLDYDLLIYSANWPAARRAAWRALLPARAIENQAYCVGANRIGDDAHGISHAGDSMVLDFMGQPLLELHDRPLAATVPIDIEAVRGWREKFPTHLDADAFSLE